MARSSTPNPPEEFDEHIIDTDITDEMSASYIEYAYSVIYSRAIPDARDGLKPVQRRTLFTMDDMGLRNDRGHVKSARVVGEVMGRLHPHGDSAIYDALVRLVQPWSMRLPLVDGHGNFGSPDDPPAAMRYTECRMDEAAEAMTASIDEDTVDFKPNYDGRELEPSVLPASLPNLLVNGASGIAVGMATNIAPHNLVEVVQALRHLIEHPRADLDDLMRFIPGPDLPTGGKIVGLDGVRDAYATGNGSFRMRATTRVENVTPRRKGIVVTELPYNVGTEKVVEAIKKLVQAKKLQGISDIKNLTDRHKGLQLVIEVKNGIVPEVLLEQLYKHTPMESSFSINAVALVDGQPRTLGLKEMLEVFLAHRFQVVRRRSEFRRAKAAARLHLVEGLLVAILDIDEVIQLIRSSDNRGEARSRLMGVFDLSEAQADFILDRTLGSLTRFSRIELEKEADELRAAIERLEEILGDDGVLRAVVSDELDAAAQRFGTPRRTVLLESAGQTVTAAAQLEVADDPCWVLLSATGLLARTSDDSPLGDVGRRSKHDVVVSAVAATARGQVGLVTADGTVHRLDVLDIPTLPATAQAPHLQGGLPLRELLATSAPALCLMSLEAEGPGLALATRAGVVKRVKPEVLSRDSWEVIGLADGDTLVGAAPLATGDEQLVLVTSDAQLLRFEAGLVRPQGRGGGGVAGVKLAAGQRVVGFGVVRDVESAHVLTISGSGDALPGTQTGAAKVSPLSAYPAKGRATGGVRCHRLLKGEDGLILGWVGDGTPVACATSGSPVDLPEIDPRRDGSGVAVAQPVLAAASPAGLLPGLPTVRD
ncbi:MULTISPECIES: DNA topoisomerase (ATP-hydrolyzing) subunit A [unclassified Aeromicrobium]|uniref:DNA gyrase/topoisomerase IV subunit A n=1 Tax=unclassified Aeromicrobium TaxID=2633570 RepID=UPI0006FD35E2|nr:MULTISPECIES: DNA topoisomerase IV subunit A [unclassified Aeromicrobium]KQO38954.1 DNA topoisomerase IV [Aeromicrobium sp. Leaf245]KQP24810.1 DNA topoisomerase IV [Aeromicrobium sp. Leaf272]KQP79692.1 DNA topoisomerase IV [Aeromicrobium sp. Leaf289]KQP82216.1 DNA topoisomerase IV [Aeromicrobium sp. Leaf291]